MSRPTAARCAREVGPSRVTRAAWIVRSAWLAWIACAACAAGSPRSTTASLRAFRYSDSSGLSVTSDGLEVEQPVGGGVTVQASGLVEEIVTPGGAAAGDGDAHDHLAALARARPDVITTASAVASSGAPGQKRRVEANLGARASRLAGDTPVEVGLTFRTSQEPDYQSLSGALHVSAGLFEQNLTLAAFAGYGADTISPLVKPAGQDALWPAQHHRVNGGVALTQLLSPELALSGGLSVNYQYGRLANPYRRALVATTLFPESVPAERLRGTAFARLAWWLGRDTALHLRQGFYADDWGVRALVPEISLAHALGKSGLLIGRGRLYLQSAARFYQANYAAVEPLMTGDVRLGRVAERLLGAEARWTFVGDLGAPGSFEGMVSYDRSWISYPDVDLRIGADVLSIAVMAAF